MSVNKITSKGWSILWLLFAASIVIPFFLHYIASVLPVIALVLGIAVVLFVIYRVAKAWMAHKYMR